MKASILGCGWLGLPLAQAMIADGFTVKGSTTTPEKLPALADAGIEPYVLSLSTTALQGGADGFLADADILIIDIPPKLKEGDFTDKIQVLMPHIEKSGIKKVVFVSSISVYGNNQGLVTEDTLPLPDSDNGKQLLEAEKMLLANANFQTTILRFGGLVGGERHPVYHLAGRENLPDPDAPINLIHRDDCVGIILSLIRQNIWGGVFNGVAPFHPSRMDYYTGKANEMGLPLPAFAPSGNEGKTVRAEKLARLTGYAFSSLL
ncbi:SDR family oxidoreductase [Flavobacterium sp. MFBS3-15]|uniref:SDR family oxidoreductase n=1 Tax=Flavobacterium sp. MFBS3-15 TaxID=2989816 RepID=UPI0022354CBB|nr:SDR family oxidoreductase [Flavobacterium sp. MFBS3-15]MCW4469266.1 SDR family oxidoreductase [Flavobacterium sp. MFBS3-15]